MTTSEVPTAMGIGSPASRASAGTSRKPPPAPTSPLITPTAMPSRTIRTTGRCWSPSAPVASLRPRSIARPAAIMITVNATNSIVPGMNRATRPRHSAGHRDHAEACGDAPAHPAGSGMGDRRDRAGHPDHEQGRGDGVLGFHASYAGEQRNGQDGSAAAEEAQRNATKTARPKVNAIIPVSSLWPGRATHRRVGPRSSGRHRWHRGCGADATAPSPSRGVGQCRD